MFATRPLRMQATQSRLGPLPVKGNPKRYLITPPPKITISNCDERHERESLILWLWLNNHLPRSAHTVSQRLRTLKKIPPELFPLGFVLSVAIGAATYSLIKKLRTDKTLRLSRPKPEDVSH
ncbi:hypothetical protein GX48_04707 [Paracoccidioides brasiliensis]|nr:hypothetical protein GX48_04707 [Paracoccidioides brasiliensis]